MINQNLGHVKEKSSTKHQEIWITFSAFYKLSTSAEWNRKTNEQTNQPKKKKKNLLKDKRNVEIITAGRLLRALERMIHEEMWKSKFEQSSGDKKGENQR